jgi:hypothetical protein
MPLQGFSGRSLQGFTRSLQGFSGKPFYPRFIGSSANGVFVNGYNNPEELLSDNFIKKYTDTGSKIATFARGSVFGLFMHSDADYTYSLKYTSGTVLTTINVYDSDGVLVREITPTHADISTTNDSIIFDVTDIGSNLFFTHNLTGGAKGVYSVSKTGSMVATRIYTDLTNSPVLITTDGVDLYISIAFSWEKINTSGSVLNTLFPAPAGATDLQFMDSRLFASYGFTASSTIRIYDSSLGYIGLFGSHGTGDGQFNFAAGMAAYDNELYVCDRFNSRVQVFDSTGTFIRKFSV